MTSDSISVSYTGRFAPSPTGPLHIGTLVAAMASYLEAKCHQGQWLLRIEDLDPPREIPGAANQIIHSLEKLGFEWDQEIIYQSQRDKYYLELVEALKTDHMAYACSCSRKHISGRYPGTCRNKKLKKHSDVAIRVLTDDELIEFNDALKGPISQKIENEIGDFVIRRKDGLFAYQLAVVVDDALQKITHVVRGEDLLDSTPRQIYLQKLLGFVTPEYTHTPLVIDENGQKFSKSSYRGKIPELSLKTLVQAWHHLHQQPVLETEFDNINDFWQWAIDNWQTSRIIGPTSS
jgi:glutamyl-Q tRNA(Asp) synthetase